MGVLIGFAARAAEDDLSEGCSGSASGSANSSEVWWDPKADFVTGIRTIGTMDPHVLLYVFLPALLFESANGARRCHSVRPT